MLEVLYHQYISMRKDGIIDLSNPFPSISAVTPDVSFCLQDSFIPSFLSLDSLDSFSDALDCSLLFGHQSCSVGGI